PVASRRPISAVQDPTAGVSGTILDSMNQAVSGAKIKVISDEQGFERRAETNDEGYFYVPFLPPGTYTVLIEMQGFATIRVTSLIVHAGMNSVLSLALEPKGIREIIDIKPSPSELEPASATIKYSITPKQMEMFPIVGTASGRTVLDSIPLSLPGILPG